MGFVSGAAGLGLLVFALLAGQVAAHEFGYWIARREKAKRGGAEPVGVVVGGMLGLLGFVLALTLSFADARYTEARSGALAEANAIGAAWLRADAMSGAEAKEVARLLEGYAQTREQFTKAAEDPALLEKLDQETEALQAEIWTHVKAVMRERDGLPAVSLMNSVSEAFDASAAERFAFAFVIPAPLFWLLIGMTLVGMAALGYQLGFRERPLRILSALLAAMWTAAIVIVVDLASPRFGGFRPDAAAYEWTRRVFEQGAEPR